MTDEEMIIGRWTMTDKFKLKTQKSGSSTYHFIIALRDEILGGITFKEKEDLVNFKKAYESLANLGFGSLSLEIDTKEDCQK